MTKIETQIKFDDMPAMLGEIYLGIQTLIASAGTSAKGKAPEDDLMIIEEAAKFLHLSKPTMYALVSKRQIPHIKRGNRLYFSKRALTTWLQNKARAVYN